MQPGQLVKFKSCDSQTTWEVGLVMKYDKFLHIAEILAGDVLYYAPRRLIVPYASQ
jgi:hypothetical protein